MPTRFGEPVAYTVVIVTITCLSVMLGEPVPKQVALRNAERVAARLGLRLLGRPHRTRTD